MANESAPAMHRRAQARPRDERLRGLRPLPFRQRMLRNTIIVAKMARF
jgi:hypothetical protein